MRKFLLQAALLALLMVFAFAEDHGDDDDGDGNSWACLTNPYRTVDGSCNNIFSPTLGKAGNFYRRGPDGAQYGANNAPITYPQRPYERVVSNAIARADPSVLDTDVPHTLFATLFGQFINHDLENNAFVDPGLLSYPDMLAVPEYTDSLNLAPRPLSWNSFMVCPKYPTKLPRGWI